MALTQADIDIAFASGECNIIHDNPEPGWLRCLTHRCAWYPSTWQERLKAFRPCPVKQTAEKISEEEHESSSSDSGAEYQEAGRKLAVELIDTLQQWLGIGNCGAEKSE